MSEQDNPFEFKTEVEPAIAGRANPAELAMMEKYTRSRSIIVGSFDDDEDGADDPEDPHTVWLVVDNQQFRLDDYKDTKEEADWMRLMLAKALLRVSPAPIRKNESCGCRRCLEERDERIDGIPVGECRLILCQTCGNKRCPHANDHRNECTRSNAVGQPGSA